VTTYYAPTTAYYAPTTAYYAPAVYAAPYYSGYYVPPRVARRWYRNGYYW
jgi:hypothetical protein